MPTEEDKDEVEGSKEYLDEDEDEDWDEEEYDDDIDPEETIQQIVQLLAQVCNNSSVPRNIRRAADEAIQILESDKGTPAHKASNAISILDEISQDPNCPLYARTKIWNTVSLLETIQD
ncbi:MAG: hypothetical protein GF329_18100 [Candidatus Lokiarchaeota archaeon]|nr:hypothetical protein [Candidatus Lokiarchaeota archaeon]